MTENPDTDTLSEKEDIAEVETYYHYFTHQEVAELVAKALEDRAANFDRDVAAESLRGAADQGKMSALRWGAGQLRELARVIRHMEDGEIREGSGPDPVYTTDAVAVAIRQTFEKGYAEGYNQGFSDGKAFCEEHHMPELVHVSTPAPDTTASPPMSIPPVTTGGVIPPADVGTNRPDDFNAEEWA